MARKRRADSSAVNQSSISNNVSAARPNTSSSQGQGQGQGNGLTLPQVISVIDTRLIVLETFMKDTKEVIEASIYSYNKSLHHSTELVKNGIYK